ncbi:class A beta-lactamase-related serine hydrolase [Sphingomonas donggukensis]|uniref:Class A beta-lactamase-related serine hydrolase n=1 Tax=Sphingomonas donggukensis TaxID=2949093 RepID=A0ABY4TUD7_9SPHN|nr:serine hydrolase [Sphingomonas donggukensis]URW76019.1 class A beta-lactamase-related serine hydrolase [Sphingomonas donggukensis]
MRNILAIALAAMPFAVAAPATAQVAPAAPVVAAPQLTARIEEVLTILKGGGDYDATFAPPFRAQVPREKFAAVTKQLTQAAGAPQRIASVRAVSPYAAVVTIACERAVATLQIAIDATAPYQVSGLLLSGVSAAEASVGAVDAALAALPGTTGFLLARLDDGGPKSIVARNADRAFAIGSEFKLVILATLVRDVAAGKRRWEDRVTLDGSERPAGGWARAAKGTQVSLRDLAAKMISVSDNSATDILLETVGRSQVEAMMPVVGIAAPARSRPFLTTAEVFKLKAVSALADRYLAQTEAGRRAMLAGEIARMPLSAVPSTLFADGKPVRIGELEWFFSPSDVARTLDWIRRASASGPAADVRAILAINPALPPATASRWTYAGYKGGSEPGVMAMSWLLQAKDGRWYAVSGSWNDSAKGVDEMRFASLMQRAVELAVP